MWDKNTERGANIERRLREEVVIWLTTVNGQRVPQPSPVWFLWDGTAFLIYSRPNTPKLRNIARSPGVSLNFDGDREGGEILIFTGEAAIVNDVPPAHEHPEYLAKYRDDIAGIGMTPESFAASYSVPIRVIPSSVRSY